MWWGRQGNKGLTSCVASGRMTSISKYLSSFPGNGTLLVNCFVGSALVWLRIQSQRILNRTSGCMWAWGQSLLAELKMLLSVSPVLAVVLDLLQVTVGPSGGSISLEIVEFATMYLHAMAQWLRCSGSSNVTHDRINCGVRFVDPKLYFTVVRLLLLNVAFLSKILLVVIAVHLQDVLSIHPLGISLSVTLWIRNHLLKNALWIFVSISLEYLNLEYRRPSWSIKRTLCYCKRITEFSFLALLFEENPWNHRDPVEFHMSVGGSSDCHHYFMCTNVRYAFCCCLPARVFKSTCLRPKRSVL